MTTDLIAFLSARLDEYEAAAAAAQLRFPSPWDRAVTPDSPLPSAVSLYDSLDESFGVIRGSYAADHITRHDPARTLREVEADRALLAKLQQVEELGECLRVDTEIMILRQVIAIRAAIWNDHPDYKGWLQ